MNVKVLTKDERRYLNERYTFTLSDSAIFVKIKDYGRVTAHNRGDSILITSPIRRIKLSKEAIKLWSEKYVDKYSPIDIQNAINMLKVSYQNIDDESIDAQIKRMISKDLM